MIITNNFIDGEMKMNVLKIEKIRQNFQHIVRLPFSLATKDEDSDKE